MNERLPKLRNTFDLVFRGASSTYPRELQWIADYLPVYDKDCDQERAQKDILYSILATATEARTTGLKSDLGVNKQDVVDYIACFSDTCDTSLSPAFYHFEKPATEFIEAVEDIYENEERPVSPSEQFEIALRLNDNDIAQTLMTLTIATRQMARRSDSKLIPHLEINDVRQINWKYCVSSLGLHEGFQDTAGDTYHLWEEILAGYSCQEGCDPRHLRDIKSGICTLIHRNTTTATDVLRYKLCGNEGRIHAEAVELGFEIGKWMGKIWN